MIPTKHFYGEIDGVSIYDFIKKLDYKLNQKDRIEHLKKIMYTDKGFVAPYFEEIFEQSTNNGQSTAKIRLVLSQSDSTYTDTNIAKTMEILANYILYAPDAERMDKKQEYKFYKDEEKFKKRIRERIMYIDEAMNGKNEADSIDFLIARNGQYKKAKKQVVNKEDLWHPVLKEYQDAIDNLKKFMKEHSTSKIENMALIKELDSSDIEGIQKCKSIIKTAVEVEKKYGALIKSIKQDQIIAKDMLFGTIYFKQVAPDSTVIDFDNFDYNSREQVRELLRCGLRRNINRDLDCITQDVNNIINQLNLTKQEMKRVDLLRCDCKIEDIVKKVDGDVYKQYVNMVINKIIRLIAKKNEELYEDWHYTNVEKGTYRKCSKCKEIKLIGKFNKHNIENTVNIKCKSCERTLYKNKKERARLRALNS